MSLSLSLICIPTTDVTDVTGAMMIKTNAERLDIYSSYRIRAGEEYWWSRYAFQRCQGRTRNRSTIWIVASCRSPVFLNLDASITDRC